MNREKIRRFLFVGTVCLLSFPWLTPCVGIMSGALVDGIHNSVTGRDESLRRLPSKQLKEWAAKPGPKLKVLSHQSIPRSLLVSDEEVSADRGGQKASRPGTLVGKGASAIVDGVTETLIWVDPITWVTHKEFDMNATKPKRQLVISQDPFVVIEGQDIRFTREGKNGPVRLVLARNATVTVITPEGRFSGSAGVIHYRAPSQEVVLENLHSGISSGEQRLFSNANGPGHLVKLNFVTRTVSFDGPVEDLSHRPRRPSVIDGLLKSPGGAEPRH